MRQEFFEAACGLRRQSRKHVLEIRVRIMAVEFRRLDQTHGRSGASASTQRTGEQPVVATMHIIALSQ